MTKAGISRVWGIIILTITTCFISFPVEAKYSVGTGESNDPYQIAADQEIIWGNCDPNQWRPLALPSGHWVFNEPISAQTKLVTIDVNVVDAQNKPIGNADLLAYCEPWDFAYWKEMDVSGHCRIVGPIGDYYFYAGSNQILAASQQVTISEDANVSLTGTTRLEIAFVDPNGSPFWPAGHGSRWCCLTPTNLPSPVHRLQAGGLVEGKTSWLTTPEVCGVLVLMRSPDEQAPGYVIFQDFPTNASNVIVVDDEKLGRVRFQLDGVPTCETWWNLKFDPVNNEIGAHHVVVPRVLPTGGFYEVRVTPGLYRVNAEVCRAADWAYPASWVPVILDVKPNIVYELHSGGVFEARLDVLRWDPGNVHLWVDITDNFGQYLHIVEGEAHLRLKRGNEVLFDGPVEESGGRYISFGNPLADDMRLGEPVEYEYQFSSPVLGTLSTTGVLPRDRSIHLDNPLVGQSSHFDFHSRDPVPNAVDILQLLECAYEWLVRKYSGPFSPQTGERFDLIYETAGGGNSYGDEFGSDLYSAHYLTVDPDQTGVFYHEFVHTCLWSMFAQHWSGVPRESIHELSEPQANVVGMYLARAIHGERAFRMHRQFRSNQFFSAQAAGGFVDEVDRYIFPWLYIDLRYGQAVNRDFFRAVYANECNLGAILETMDSITTERERTATLYSYFVQENLAWLYQWAGFNVSDEIVDQGVAYIQNCAPAKPVGDIDGDCMINYKDVESMAEQWLRTIPPEVILSADLNADKKVELNDFAVLAENWLAGITP